MARLHTYSSDAKESPLWWVKMGGYLAALSLAANGLWQTLPDGHQLAGLKKIATPLSVGILAPLLYWVYNNLLWKIFAGLPDLNGTWIGMRKPNYRDSPHLQVMHIVQTWSSVYIRSDSFRLPPDAAIWHDGVEYIGTNESKCATISQLLNRYSTLEFTNNHKGNGTTQMDFEGTEVLKVTVSNRQARFFRRIWRVVSSMFVRRDEHAMAEGHYYTNRFYPGEEGRRCSWGSLHFRFVSPELLTIEEVLRLVSEDQLTEVQKKLGSLSRALPDYVKAKLDALDARLGEFESRSKSSVESIAAVDADRP